jgi:predicted DNA-binding protein (MmcQ/YjbR family)
MQRAGSEIAKSPDHKSRNGLAFPASQITELQIHMTIDSLRAYCLSFPNATEKLQWGDALCFKVGGKMFVVVSLDLEDPPRLSLKCDPETFAEMIEREGVAPAPYVGRYQWIGVEALNTLPQRELESLIARSYELVVAKLPKKSGRKSRPVAPKRRRTGAPVKAKRNRRH